MSSTLRRSPRPSPEAHGVVRQPPARSRVRELRFTDPRRQALQPAIRYADEGFPVSTRLSLDIGAEVKKVAADSALARTFLVNGAAPAPGTLLVQKELAATLRVIATGGARSARLRA